MGQLRSIQIFVVGQARRPGTYTVSSLSTLVNALFTPAVRCQLGRCAEFNCGAVIVSWSTSTYTILLIKGDKSKDVTLPSGRCDFHSASGRSGRNRGKRKYPSNL